jgi:hypothetical protein
VVEKDEKGPKGLNKVVVVKGSAAPPLWARFYDIGTNMPIFADRDGVPKPALADIGYERRNGYAWYGTWPQKLVEVEYSAWKKRIRAKPGRRLSGVGGVLSVFAHSRNAVQMTTSLFTICTRAFVGPLLLIAVALGDAVPVSAHGQGLRATALLDDLVPGAERSEAGHKLKANKSETVRGALGLPARRLLTGGGEPWEGGRFEFVMKVDPDRPNYLTARFLGGRGEPELPDALL